MSQWIDVEPAKGDHGEVEVTVHNNDDPVFLKMPADEARLFGLKMIRAADASERRGW